MLGTEHKLIFNDKRILSTSPKKGKR